MGDLIEGPDRVIGYHYDELSPYRQSRRARQQESRDRPSFVLFATFILFFGIAIGGAAGLLLWNDSDARHFEAEVDGKCYRTAVGAFGKVEHAYGPSETVGLIFPSGLRESYSLKNLTETPCQQHLSSDDIKGLLQ